MEREERLAQQSLQKAILEKETIQNEIKGLTEERHHLMEEIKKMRLEAENEIKAWWEAEQEKAEGLRQEAYSEGYDHGFEQGQKEAQEQYQNKLKQAEEIVQRAYRERDEILRQAEAELLQLSLSIARKVIGDELKHNQESWNALVSNGLRQIIEQDEVMVCLPALLYPQLLPYVDEWSQLIEGQLKVIPDHTLDEGQCLLKTPYGTYDLSLDQQLEAINKQLMACFEERMARDREAGRLSGRD
jgi:flagellar assembly protein FliH